MRKTLIFTALAAMGFACQNGTEYSKELQDVDSLKGAMEDYRLKLDSLGLEKVTAVHSKVGEQQEFFTANHPDTASKEFWVNEMSYLGTIGKSLNRYRENHEELRESLDYTEAQLSALANSLRDGKLKEGEELTHELAQQYLEEEAQAVQQIKFKYDRVFPEAKRALALWESLEPRYDSISDYVHGLQ